jgi:glucosamine--fructose-6-phosphate aminotransferase (isomerizing)
VALAPVLERLADLGAPLLQVGQEGGLPIAAGGLPENLLPIVEIMPRQRLAWWLARERGGDPDRPRGLSKITQTR